jgi:hypothetical protein
MQYGRGAAARRVLLYQVVGVVRAPVTLTENGIHMKFDASNWILCDFDWSNQA